MLVLEDAETERNEEDMDAVMQESAQNFSPPHLHYIDEGASHNMLTNVENLIASVYKSLGIKPLDSPPSHHDPLGTKSPAKTYKTFPVHEQIECAVYEDWVTPESICFRPLFLHSPVSGMTS